jgi:hypothetical protein
MIADIFSECPTKNFSHHMYVLLFFLKMRLLGLGMQNVQLETHLVISKCIVPEDMMGDNWI